MINTNLKVVCLSVAQDLAYSRTDGDIMIYDLHFQGSLSILVGGYLKFSTLQRKQIFDPIGA